MPERRSGVGEHPSVEVLSAYVDGTLEARERGDVETHLAACEECYELVTEVVASEEDIDAEGDVAPPAAPVTVSAGDGARVTRRRAASAAFAEGAAVHAAEVGDWCSCWFGGRGCGGSRCPTGMAR